MRQPRILVMGCGGLGGWIAANLIENGIDVLPVTHNAEIAEVIRRNGFLLHDRSHTRRIPGNAIAALGPSDRDFDFAILATQPPQVVEAARSVLPALAPHGAVLCLQNGLCEHRVAEVAGADRTLGAVVAWGGSMIRPGEYERTSKGGFTLGRLDGAEDERFAVLRNLLDPIGRVEVTANLTGARWSKLAINCAISALGTIGGQRLGGLIGYRFVRRLGLEVMTEAVITARRQGVRLEKVAGTIDLDWATLEPPDVKGSGSLSLAGKHALLLAVGAKFRRLRSSMLVAIERGRAPAVDFLNGEIVHHAALADVAVPVNERIVATVNDIWRGNSRPGMELLRRLYDQSRGDAYAATGGGYALPVASFRSQVPDPKV